MLRLIIPFILGFLLQYYRNNPVELSYAMLGLSSVLLGILEISRLAKRFSFYYVQGVCINLAFVALGSINCHIKNPFPQRASIAHFPGTNKVVVAAIEEPFVEKKSSWKALARIEYIYNGDSTIDPATNIIVYIRKDGAAVLPKYGSRIIFDANLAAIRNYEALKGFDYQRYCALKNIHYHVFLKAGNYRILPGDRSDFINRFIFRLQKWTVVTLKENIDDKRACGMAMALLIGYKNELDPNILRSYSNTGVVHVIAISGLHLGIIYVILSFCCHPLLRLRRLSWINPLIILIGLWTFSLLAGASPSVVRSSVMFTFIVTGRLINRNGTLYNNLAASALCLLAYNPFWLFDLGFQLSYAALLGIAVYAKKLYSIYVFRNKVMDHLWQLNTVTIAAQVFTTPIILYQFHQFPSLFILTNFVAIPVSTVILLTEIVLCGTSLWPVISRAFGGVITWLINMLNWSVVSIEKLPYSSMTGLEISLFQTVMAYVFIICVSCWLLMHQRKYVKYGLYCAILFFVPPWLKIWQ